MLATVAWFHHLVAALFIAVLSACGGGQQEPAAEGASASPATASPAAGSGDHGDDAPRRTGDGLLAVGERAPAFSAPDQTGATQTLAQHRGHPVVLYFYPKDATPGCTLEACAFRDAWNRLQATGAVVLGVSTDTVESHAAFAAEHELPFSLLADPDGGALCRTYGACRGGGWARRVTYLIDGDGIIRRVYPNVDPGVHADEVVAALDELSADS